MMISKAETLGSPYLELQCAETLGSPHLELQCEDSINSTLPLPTTATPASLPLPFYPLQDLDPTTQRVLKTQQKVQPNNHSKAESKSLKTKVHNVQPDPLKDCKNKNNDDENDQPKFVKKEIQQSEDKVRVGIKNLAKETIYLAASPEETILQFKQRMTGFWTLTPAKFQVLKLGDKILENDTLISDLALDSVLTFEKI